MNDCRFGVSPVNYPDPDPDPELFFRFTERALRKLLSIYVFSYVISLLVLRAGYGI